MFLFLNTRAQIKSDTYSSFSLFHNLIFYDVLVLRTNILQLMSFLTFAVYFYILLPLLGHLTLFVSIHIYLNLSSLEVCVNRRHDLWEKELV